MKLNKIVYPLMFSALLTLGMQSCFQDLDQDPPFNYPEEKGDPLGSKGEVLYMSFDDNTKDGVTNLEATKVGSPSFQVGKKGKAYAGATASYLTFDTKNLIFEKNFSAAFWYKLNKTPDRAGILVFSSVNPTNANANKMSSGFRLFREDAGGKQVIKLNVGMGVNDKGEDQNTWVDGGADASVEEGVWVYVAFTLSETKCVVYINGNIAKSVDFAGVNWDGTGLLSIGSGAPRFVEWNHLSDLSLIDELRIFKKALTQDEVKALMND